MPLTINKMDTTDKTKTFIKQVKALEESGVVKSREEIIKKLKWDKSSMSQVMNGSRNVPNYIYSKFAEVYTVPIEDDGSLTMQSLIQLEAMCQVILGALAEVLANQRSQPVTKVLNDLLLTVNSQVTQRLDKLK